MALSTQKRFRWLAAVAAAALVVLASPVAGAHHKDGHKPNSTGTQVDVVVSGLDSPRGLSFGPGGVLYITEAGRGGDGPCYISAPGPEVCYGPTGKITAFANGQHWTVADDLPSVADDVQFDVFGPHEVAWSGLGLLVPIGLGADPAVKENLGPEGEPLGTVLRVNPRTGAWSIVADVAEYEALNDPDADQFGGPHPDTNPFGLTVHGSTVTVADAGGNSILQFKQHPKRLGEISTLAVLPYRLADAPPFLGLPPGTQIPMQPVPTAVEFGPGGAYYVGQLTGFPFPVGGANVYRIKPGGEPTVYASGFTNIVDVTFDSKGRLLVLEMFTNGLLGAQQDPSGALWRIERDGSRTLIADGSDGLLAPAGVAVARDGSYYVTNKGVFGPGAGEVLHIRR